jgi:pimeloyl-ACP methyl ester carboxylesterase
MNQSHLKILILALQMLWSMDVVSALNPSREYKQLPEKFNMIYQAHSVPTADGANLQAWYFPAKVKTTKLILICHNGEGNMADYLQKIEAFGSLGYNIVTFDYRGFGKSSDFKIDNNYYIYPQFQDDVKAMIDFCRKQFVANFDIYGWGMGSGLALGIGWNRPEIKKIIADTPFLSMEDLEKRFSSWDTPMEVPLAGFDKKFEPIYALDLAPTVTKNVPKSILLIIGSNDILFKVSDMKALQAKQPKMVAKDIYTVPNPDRIDNFLVDKAAYSKVIDIFLRNPK